MVRTSFTFLLLATGAARRLMPVTDPNDVITTAFCKADMDECILQNRNWWKQGALSVLEASPPVSAERYKVILVTAGLCDQISSCNTHAIQRENMLVDADEPSRGFMDSDNVNVPYFAFPTQPVQRVAKVEAHSRALTVGHDKEAVPVTDPNGVITKAFCKKNPIECERQHRNWWKQTTLELIEASAPFSTDKYKALLFVAGICHDDELACEVALKTRYNALINKSQPMAGFVDKDNSNVPYFPFPVGPQLGAAPKTPCDTNAPSASPAASPSAQQSLAPLTASTRSPTGSPSVAPSAAPNAASTAPTGTGAPDKSSENRHNTEKTIGRKLQRKTMLLYPAPLLRGV